MCGDWRRELLYIPNIFLIWNYFQIIIKHSFRLSPQVKPHPYQNADHTEQKSHSTVPPLKFANTTHIKCVLFWRILLNFNSKTNWVICIKSKIQNHAYNYFIISINIHSQNLTQSLKFQHTSFRGSKSAGRDVRGRSCCSWLMQTPDEAADDVTTSLCSVHSSLFLAFDFIGNITRVLSTLFVFLFT